MKRNWREIAATVIVAATLAACGETKPRASFLVAFNELDRAPWTALCGPGFEGVQPPGNDPVIVFQTLDRRRSLHTYCVVDGEEGSSAVTALSLKVGSFGPDREHVVRDLHVAQRDLLATLVPPRLWPYVLIASESAGTELGAYGFAIRGGLDSWNGDRRLAVSTYPREYERAELEADLAAIRAATRDAGAQGRLVDAYAAPVRSALSQLLQLELGELAGRTTPVCPGAGSPRCGHTDEQRREVLRSRIAMLRLRAEEATHGCDGRIRSAREAGARDRDRTIARLVAIDQQLYRQVRAIEASLPRWSDEELRRLGDVLESHRRSDPTALIDALVALPLDDDRAAAHSSR